MTATALAGNEETALLGALESIIRKTTPTTDSIRGVVEQVVDERMPRVVEVHHGEMNLGAVEGWVRPEFDKIALAVFTGENTMLFGPADRNHGDGGLKSPLRGRTRAGGGIGRRTGVSENAGHRRTWSSPAYDPPLATLGATFTTCPSGTGVPHSGQRSGVARRS